GKRCDRTLEFFEHLSALLVGLPDSCTRVCRCAFASYFQTGFASLDELPRLFGCLSYVPEMYGAVELRFRTLKKLDRFLVFSCIQSICACVRGSARIGARLFVLGN